MILGRKITMQFSRSILAAIVLFGALVIASSPARAGVMTSGCADSTSCTFDELFNGGGAIQVNGLIFYDWFLADAGGDFVSAPDLDQMTVFADDLGLDTELFYDPGFQLDVLSDLDGAFGFFDFGYSILATQKSLKAASLALDFTFFDGEGGVIDILMDIIGIDVASLGVFEDNLFDDAFLFDETELGGLYAVDVFTSINILSDFADELVGLDGFTQIYSIPEPSTLALLGLGLLGMGAVARRNRA